MLASVDQSAPHLFRFVRLIFCSAVDERIDNVGEIVLVFRRGTTIRIAAVD